MFLEEDFFGLKAIDAALPGTAPGDRPKLFARVPLEIFARLSLERPPELPNLAAYFPAMPPDQLQQQWVGNSGPVLLNQSVAFVRSLVGGFHQFAGRDMATARVLDYGCGWGRLSRLLLKYVPETALFGVDPDRDILRVATETGVRGSLAPIDPYPTALPFAPGFDLIFAFSVLTHLSPKAAQCALALWERNLSPGGLVALTVFPAAYWRVTRKDGTELAESHARDGWAYMPHNRPAIDGDISYGETSLSLGHIERDWTAWEIVSVEHNACDAMQVIVFLKKREPAG